ncbi:hypothetical protein AeNC1_012358 [Aphanomyces euteiches]|nr:hypothetical protein AeNC1_012358 [Aphanomyces euteiches]
MYRNDASAWASPPYIVSKPGTNKYRMTVDVRAVNAKTLPVVWPMPAIEVIMENLTGSSCFVALDFFKGYWQFPLSPCLQDYFTIMTDQGCFTPTRIPTGGSGSVAYCQSTVTNLFKTLLYKCLLIWIDDLLVYSNSQTELMLSFEKVLEICLQSGLKLNPEKCDFFATEVKWCGKLVSGSGIRHDPSRIHALRDLPVPKTGADLQQFMCAVNWLRTHIPRYNEVVNPLSTALQRVYTLSGSKTKSILSRFTLPESFFSRDELENFEAVKRHIADSVKLALPDPSKLVCVFPDASNKFWGSIITQIPMEKQNLPLQDQEHAPLAFLSGTFRGAQMAWSILEKEAFAIVETCKRMDYLLQRPSGFKLYTDHRNLTFLYDPSAFSKDLTKYTAEKVQRWGLIMMSFTYTIQHINGESNVWADLLSRWGSSNSPPAIQALKIVNCNPSPLQDRDFVWPSMAEICSIQVEAIRLQIDNPTNVSTSGNPPFLTSTGQIWIPDGLDESQPPCNIKIRIMILAHCGAAGHRGIDSTTQTISERYFWTDMASDVTRFCKQCFHCQKSAAGKVIPVPLGSQIHASMPNEILHFDFLYVGPSDTGEQYVCLLKDDHSMLVQYTPHVAADTEAFCTAAHRWFDLFGIVKTWVSDQGSHFKNHCVAEMQRVYGAHHHFTLPGCPWSNGTIEIVNKQFLKLLRCLLAEWKLPHTQWPRVISVAAKILNHSPSRLLKGLAHITVFCGLKPSLPLDGLVDTDTFEVVDYNDFISSRYDGLEDLQRSLQNMHRSIAEYKDKVRSQKRGQRKAQPRQFTVGEFVLVLKRSTNIPKTLYHWDGPWVVYKVVFDWCYEVQNYESKTTIVAHACRLKPYTNGTQELSNELLESIKFCAIGNEVKSIIDARYTQQQDQFECLVVWLGMDDESTWEPAQHIYEDVFQLFKQFLSEKLDTTPPNSAKRKLFDDMAKKFPLTAFPTRHASPLKNSPSKSGIKPVWLLAGLALHYAGLSSGRAV